MSPLDRAVQHARRAAGPDPAGDRQLLAAFAATHDQAAFAELVRRHGTLVRGVCRRVLGADPAADDAFQATFLLLARKAGASGWGESLAGWLHATARHVAAKARRAAERRRRREAHAPPRPPGQDPAASVAWRELCGILDEELARLPERLRGPLALCYLEGRTRDEAARALGWPLGTLKRGLARGRALLRVRLTRRGVTLAAAGLPAILVESPVPAAVVTATAEVVRTYVAGGSVAAAVGELVQSSIAWLTPVKLGIAGVTLAVGGFVAGVTVSERSAETPPQVAPVGQAPQAQARDQFGDPLPPGAIARLGSLAYRLEPERRESIAYSPDGQTFVTAGGSAVHFWSASTGRIASEPIYLPNQGCSVDSLAFAADGKTLWVKENQYALGKYPTVMSEWDVASRTQFRRLPLPEAYPFYWRSRVVSSHAASSAFATSGMMLAYLDKDEAVRIWDLRTAREQGRVNTTGDELHDLAISADGKTLITMHGQSARVWDIATRRELRRFDGDSRQQQQLVLSPDGRYLATTGRKIKFEPGPDGTSVGLEASPDPEVYLWDVTTGERLHTIDPKTRTTSVVAFTPDSRSILTGSWYDGHLQKWDLATGQRVWQSVHHHGAPQRLVFTADGRTVAGISGQRLATWDLATGRETRTDAGHTSAIKPNGITFAPDGRRVFTESHDGTRREWDPTNGRLLKVAPIFTDGFDSIAYAPDRRRLLSRYAGDRALLTRLRDAETGRVLAEWPAGVSGFSHDSRWLALLTEVENARILRLCDAATGREVWSAPLGEPPIARVHVLFTGDDRRVTVEDGVKVRTWDVATGRLPVTWDVPVLQPVPKKSDFPINVAVGYPGMPVYDSAYSPDRSHLVLSLARAMVSSPEQEWSRVVICEAVTGKIVKTLPHFGAYAERLTFAPDGQTLATVNSKESAVYLWEVRTGRMLRKLTGHHGGIVTIAFSPDGRRLVTGGNDTTGLVWDVSDLR